MGTHPTVSPLRFIRAYHSLNFLSPELKEQDSLLVQLMPIPTYPALPACRLLEGLGGNYGHRPGKVFARTALLNRRPRPLRHKPHKRPQHQDDDIIVGAAYASHSSRLPR